MYFRCGCGNCERQRDYYRMGYSDGNVGNTTRYRLTVSTGRQRSQTARPGPNDTVDCVRCYTPGQPATAAYCSVCGEPLHAPGQASYNPATSNQDPAGYQVQEAGTGGGRPAGTRDIPAMSWSWVPEGYLGFAKEVVGE